MAGTVGGSDDTILVHASDYDPAQALLESLSRHETALKLIYDALTGKARPMPTLIDLGPTRGRGVRTHTRLRAQSIIGSGGAGDRIQVRVSQEQRFEIYNVSGVPYSVPFPYIIERGVDLDAVNVTTPASLVWSLYLVASEE